MMIQSLWQALSQDWSLEGGLQGQMLTGVEMALKRAVGKSSNHVFWKNGCHLASRAPRTWKNYNVGFSFSQSNHTTSELRVPNFSLALSVWNILRIWSWTSGFIWKVPYCSGCQYSLRYWCHCWLERLYTLAQFPPLGTLIQCWVFMWPPIKQTNRRYYLDLWLALALDRPCFALVGHQCCWSRHHCRANIKDICSIKLVSKWNLKF